MAPKLTDSDKNTIVELYQHPDESTATLASRYGVSSSTISRILKQVLSEQQYKEIVKQKKGGGSKPQTKGSGVSVSKPSIPEPSIPEQQTKLVGISNDVPSKRVKPKDTQSVKSVISKSSSQLEEPSEPSLASNQSDVAEQEPNGVAPKPTPVEQADNLQLSLADTAPPPPILKKNRPKPSVPQDNLTDDWGDEIPANLLDMEDLDDEELDDEDLDDLEGDLDDDDDNSSDGDDFSDLDEGDLAFPLNADMLSVLPFSEAKLPRTCYLIIDRAAELITRPLKAFSDLGEVPAADVDELTLPIFDNHRVAKRFVNRRTQRIVKVPDAQVLRKTSSYLMDKGITRLLLGGQVYALMDDEIEDYDYSDDYN
ncbi:MAG: helix-turn-helix domain-containing protein [Cyanothece sp. SIO2G6]|nr:helix-turn-helix domain-containing protein [Cyanothece sp. SIO2G6]